MSRRSDTRRGPIEYSRETVPVVERTDNDDDNVDDDDDDFDSPPIDVPPQIITSRKDQPSVDIRPDVSFIPYDETDSSVTMINAKNSEYQTVQNANWSVLVKSHLNQSAKDFKQTMPVNVSLPGGVRRSERKF
jgi:hypothetical protein